MDSYFILGTQSPNPLGLVRKKPEAPRVEGIATSREHAATIEDTAILAFDEDGREGECDDNYPTDCGACAMGRAFHAWKLSEDENLQRYVEKNLPWQQVVKKLKTTERAVQSALEAAWGWPSKQEQEQDENDEDGEKE